MSWRTSSNLSPASLLVAAALSGGVHAAALAVFAAVDPSWSGAHNESIRSQGVVSTQLVLAPSPAAARADAVVPLPAPADPQASDSEKPKPEEVKPVEPPPQEPVVRPGIDGSESDLLNWLGFLEATPHAAAQSTIDQSALSPVPGPRVAPSRQVGDGGDAGAAPMPPPEVSEEAARPSEDQASPPEVKSAQAGMAGDVTAQPKPVPVESGEQVRAPALQSNINIETPVRSNELPVGEPVSAPVGEPVSAPVSEPVSAPVGEPVGEPVLQPQGSADIPPARPVVEAGSSKVDPQAMAFASRQEAEEPRGEPGGGGAANISKVPGGGEVGVGRVEELTAAVGGGADVAAGLAQAAGLPRRVEQERVVQPGEVERVKQSSGEVVPAGDLSLLSAAGRQGTPLLGGAGGGGSDEGGDEVAGALVERLSSREGVKQPEEQARELVEVGPEVKAEGEASPVAEQAPSGARDASGASDALREVQPVKRVGVPGLPAAGTGLGIISDGMSDAAAMESAIEIKPGKVLAGKGLQIRTVRPEWAVATRLSASPRNPVVKITFGRSGRVIRASFVEGQSTGEREVDGPLLAALYRWTAKGEQLSALPQPPAAVARIVEREDGSKQTVLVPSDLERGLTLSFRVVLRDESDIDMP